jgi:hypothetical protein
MPYKVFMKINWEKQWKTLQPMIMVGQFLILCVTAAKVIYPKEVFTCGLNTYNPSQIICIKE